MKFACLFVFFCVMAMVQSDGERRSFPGDFTLPLSVSNEIRKEVWKPPSYDILDLRMSFNRAKGPPVRVSTKMGAVDGVMMRTCRKYQQYAAFFGMPYAKPPVGNGRFKAPMPAEPWDGVYDASFERPMCMQFNGPPNQESEDCLYVNVYTPSWDPNCKPKPVMVFIHGGGFMGGSSNFTLYAPDLFIENDVLLVTLNYRLGALGFLSLQTTDIPGNAALKDQKLALEWVRDNIGSFGGDPNSVTIFGESAGSASVSYHILSKSSQGLFHKAIMESGTAVAPWALVNPEDSVKMAKTLAKKLGCPASGQAMIDCMMMVSPYKIVEEQEKGLTLSDLINLKPFPFLPTKEPKVEGAFLTENPIDILQSKNFNQVPTIIGLNSREGLLILPTLRSLDPLNIAMNLLSYNLGSFFPTQVKSSLTDRERNYLNTALRKFYGDMKPVGTFKPLKITDIITDVAFLVPIQYMASSLADSSQPVYNYVFTYDGEYGYYKKNLKVTEEGVCHGDELGYIFYDADSRFSVNETRYAEAEKVANMVMGMWTNFAKTGNPTPGNSAVIWPCQKTDKPVYAEIGKEFRTSSELSAGFDSRYKFWISLITEIMKSN